MFSNGTRILIGVIFGLSLLLLLYIRIYELAAVAAVMILLLVWDYFKQGTLVVAAKFFHNKDYDKAERMLLQIKQPTLLSKKRRGFYEFIFGGICLQKQDFDAAEKHYEVAAEYPLRSINDHVAALAHVANISIRQGNYTKAHQYLDRADKHEEEVTAKMKQVIERLKKEIKNK